MSENEKEFRNATKLNFIDISSEEARQYTFVEKGFPVPVVIKNPLKLAVTQNGHRIFDEQGISHYVPSGWVHLKWTTKEGRPHFVF